MGKLTEVEPLLVALLELRYTNNVGAIALTDMLIETYQDKYGKLKGYKPFEVEAAIPDKKVQKIYDLLEKKRKVFTDQSLLDIVDQLLKVLKKSLE